jgi:hypothetical protein
MPALVMTAAEIAAAEALAAEILIAQQATAATAATAEAVQVANAAQATQATTQAAQAAQATTQAAQATQATQASTSGLQALAQEVGTTVQPTGLETLNVATGPVPTAAEEQVLQAFQNAQANTPSMTGREFLNNSYAGEVTALPSDFTAVGQAPVDAGMSAIKPAPDMSAKTVTHNFDSVKPFANPTFTAPPVEAATADFTAGTGEALGRGSYASPSAPAAPPVDAVAADFTAGTGEALGRGSYASPSAPAAPPVDAVAADFTAGTGEALGKGTYAGSSAPAAPAPATGIQNLFNEGVAYAEKHPISTGLSAMSAYNMLNQPEPYKREKYKSTFDSSTYRPYEPTPPDPYRPQYPQYAQGGLADLGGYADYAHGGRMLKGPGDGMSDDIPATIANKQPARLANEEFVIPADVVSHLGNGSSEAGAKALYKMMDRVRRARTGNKKQGKQINPEKYLA